MAGLSRYVEVLDLFKDVGRGGWTIAEMSDALGVPASTLYRTVRDMLSAQLLEMTSAGVYRLGAFFVEYDRLVRLSDPFQRLGASLLHDLAEQVQLPCTVILARLYNNTVMCVADTGNVQEHVKSSYSRGQPRPLTAGATSKVILAQLPARHYSKLVSQSADPDQRRTLIELKPQMAAIRRSGYAVTYGEVDKGAAGIAAPIALPEQGIVGSLSLVLDASGLTQALINRLTFLVVSAANLLTQQISAFDPAE